MSREVVRGDGSDELRVLEALEVLGDLQMLGVAVGPAEPAVGHFADDALHEPVLAPLGRSGVVVDLEQLLADDAREFGSSRFGRHAADECQAFSGERLSENGCVLDEVPVRRDEPVEPCSHNRLE